MQETQETPLRSLGWEDLPEKGMATHSSILAWKISWTEEPWGLQFIGLQTAGHNWVTKQKQKRIALLLGSQQANALKTVSPLGQDREKSYGSGSKRVWSAHGRSSDRLVMSRSQHHQTSGSNQSIGLQRVGHAWDDLAAEACFELHF